MGSDLITRLRRDLEENIIHSGDLLILVVVSGRKNHPKVEIPTFVRGWYPQFSTLSLLERHFPDLDPNLPQNGVGRYSLDLDTETLTDTGAENCKYPAGLKLLQTVLGYAHMALPEGGMNYKPLDHLRGAIETEDAKPGDLLILGLPLDRKGRSQSGVPTFVREWSPQDLILQLSETYLPECSQNGSRRYSLNLDSQSYFENEVSKSPLGDFRDNGPEVSPNQLGLRVVQSVRSYVLVKVERN